MVANVFAVEMVCDIPLSTVECEKRLSSAADRCHRHQRLAAARGQAGRLAAHHRRATRPGCRAAVRLRHLGRGRGVDRRKAEATDRRRRAAAGGRVAVTDDVPRHRRRCEKKNSHRRVTNRWKDKQDSKNTKMTRNETVESEERHRGSRHSCDGHRRLAAASVQRDRLKAHHSRATRPRRRAAVSFRHQRRRSRVDG